MGHPQSLETRAKISVTESQTKKGHVIISPETRAKMSVARMGNKNALGHHPSVGTRVKMSVAQTGRKVSIEGRTRMSAAQSNRSPETRKKMSTANRGHIASPETRAKMSRAQVGLLSYRWQGGITPEKMSGYSRKHSAKRRDLGHAYLNEQFSGCEGHHVDNEQVIFLPKGLHRSVYHNQHTGQGIAKINAIAYNFLFKQEVEAAIAAKGD